MMSLTSDPLHSGDIYVLDTWPFLERTLKGEVIPRIDELVRLATLHSVRLLMSEINLGEIFYSVAKRHNEQRAESNLIVIRNLPIEIVPVTSAQVFAAALLKARHAISYADCFCAALAQEVDGTVLTGDPDFLSLRDSGLLRVEWLGA